MQRYHPPNCTSAVSNTAIAASSARDSGRLDSSTIGNYSLNSRRQPPLTPYKLKSEKDGLNSRLGPPDFHPPTSSSPEENLTKEYVQFGYKETVDGLKESEEIILTQVHTFSKPVVLKCKEAVRKCLRAINESRALKRKAGQVYGVPLSGSLLCKPGFPEVRPCGEETKKKWIESLSQQHKRLCSLADNIPGYRRKTLFEVLIRNNVPLLRATWFIKVTYLNQVRPSSAAISLGTPDKTQASRCEQWTKDVIEYLQFLLEELLSRNNSYPAQTRDRSPQMLYTGSMPKISPASASLSVEETSLHFKWWYMVRLLQWHHAEGLLFPNLIVDWVLRLLQEKDTFEILQLLLPIVYGVLESIVLSQTYVQNVVAVAVRFIQEPAPGGSDLVDNSRRAYTLSALVEMVRYLVLAAPDAFVASDCFPLPRSIAACGPNDASYSSKAYGNLEKLRSNSAEISTQFQGRGADSRFEFLSFDYTISTIKRSADDLAKIASAGYPQHNVAKAVQALDKALSDGDIRIAYCYLFEDLCSGAVDETWIAEVSPCLRSSLRWIGAINTSFVCSVFFLIEWATCEFRDFRAGVPKDIKFSGRKDCSQVYLVIQLLKQKILGGEFAARKGKNLCSNFLGVSKPSSSFDAFESPGPLHDIIVCWIDQHEVHTAGAKRLQLLVFELIRSGIFNPIAYARQLIVSGMIDLIQPAVDPERRRRHHYILRQLPGCFVHDTLEEAQLLGGDNLSEAVRTYSNERRLLLRELSVDKGKYLNNLVLSDQKSRKSSTSLPPVYLSRTCNGMADNEVLRKHAKSSVDIRELKERISVLLQFPGMSSGMTNSAGDEFQSSVKRSSASLYSKTYQPEATPGCEDCRRAKRQKVNDEKSSCYQGNSPIASDEEDNWWIKKGSTTLEPSLKVDPPIELNKQVPRVKQKMARKTQSLAQLQAVRIEGSQGASTSHICDNKVSCPHHGPGVEGENHKVVDVFRTSVPVDIVSVGNSLKQLQFVDKRSIAVWLTTLVRQLVEGSEKSSMRVGQFNQGAPFEEKNTIRWKLGADELSSILYLMDISLDLVSVVKLLLWLLPKANSGPNFAVQGSRSLFVVPRNAENNTCKVGEAILVSSLRRYENILLSADLVPEAMTALMTRAASLMSSNGKFSGSAALVYARSILKRYGSLPSVVEWHNNFKATCEKRLLSELDHTRSVNGEYGIPLGVPAGVDPDDHLRRKYSGTRPSRVGLSMRELVQQAVEGAFPHPKKLIGTGTMKASPTEKNDDGYQVAQQMVVVIMDLIKGTGGAGQEGEPSLVFSAVSTIINSAGASMARISDFSVGNLYQNHPSGIDSSNFARHILQIHITCLCLLKEALGERQSRAFEVALATESSTALAGAFAPGKGSRGQHQLSPESSYDSNVNNTTNDMPNGTGKIVVTRTTKVSAAVSALVIGAITHGVITLERIVSLLRLRENLDFVQFVRRTKSNSNGSARSVGASKVENPIEVSVHWFRLLIGNCKTVSDGLVLELVGKSSVVAISRMQRMLPLKLVFLPAFSIMAYVLWRPFVSNGSSNSGFSEDTYRLLTTAFHDVIKHHPFRDVCLRDTQGLYELMVADSTDAEFASVLESNGLDMHLKSVTFAPLRARLFLNSIIDCKMPSSGYSHEGVSEAKNRHQGNGMKLVDKLVSVLDCLQPAKFHWQWVELRLLLNEQALTEKLENHDMPITDAIRSSCPSSEKPEASENEKNFIQILLTRLLVRPDAVPLFSEVVHLFGRSVEDSMLKQAEWFLAGQDVLFGRKTIRQKLIIVGESKGLPTKPQYWKPWGWCNNSSSDPITANKAGKKRKLENTSIEEGEMIDEGSGSRKALLPRALDENSSSLGYGITTERAFVELVLPCIDQSSDESRSTFVNELVRQFSNIEQQLSSVTNRSTTNTKHTGTASSASEASSNKGSTRKGFRGGSPSLARRSSSNATTDTAPPPSPAALRASMSLRLQFLLRLLPVICGEPSFRNTRHTLASTIVRLLGSRVVYEDSAVCSPRSDLPKPETESTIDASSMADLSSEVLFDRLLFVLHGLLSNHQPNWLKPRPSSNESSKDFTLFDRDAAESLQNEIARMKLPDAIRRRIQTAMPILVPSPRCSLSCQPPSVPPAALTLVHPSGPGPNQRNSPAIQKAGTATSQGKLKQAVLLPPQQQEAVNTDVVDPWMLLEDGTSSGQSSSNTANSSDMANSRATCWLKGAVRVRRGDLTYVGSVDEDS